MKAYERTLDYVQSPKNVHLVYIRLAQLFLSHKMVSRNDCGCGLVWCGCGHETLVIEAYIGLFFIFLLFFLSYQAHSQKFQYSGGVGLTEVTS